MSTSPLTTSAQSLQQPNSSVLGRGNEVFKNLAPHELAYVERVAHLRRDYVCHLLKSQMTHDRDVFNRCTAYVLKHEPAHRIYKQQVDYEFYCDDDWGTMTWRRQLHVMLEYPFLTTPGTTIAAVQILLILANVVVLFLETEPSQSPIVHPQNSGTFFALEITFTLIFTFETLMRLYVHPNRPHLLHKISFISDFVSCLPLYITLFVSTMAPEVVHTVDAIRMLRLMRLVKYLRAIGSIEVMLTAAKNSLTALSGPLFFLIFFVFIAASLVYYWERGDYDAAEGAWKQKDCPCGSRPIKQINRTEADCGLVDAKFGIGMPLSIWWSFVTTMGVGYGQFVPLCGGGRTIAAICMIMAVIIIAMPIAVMGGAFTAKLQERQKEGRMERMQAADRYNRIHQKALQIIVAKKLHEVRPEKLVMLCRHYHLPMKTPPQMRQALYEYFGVDHHQEASSPRHGQGEKNGGDIDDIEMQAPSSPKKEECFDFELPIVMSLGESLVDYLRKRYPFSTINFLDPSPLIVDSIDNFFDRVFGTLTKDPSLSYCSQRLHVLTDGELQKIIPLYRRTRYSVGVECDSVDKPDICLPLSSMISQPLATLAPRLAIIEVIRQFGMTRYFMKPYQNFRPLVHGQPIPDGGILLQDRDAVNFGTEDLPLVYTFVLLDEFAYAAHQMDAIDPEVGANLWGAKGEYHQYLVKNGIPMHGASVPMYLHPEHPISGSIQHSSHVRQQPYQQSSLGSIPLLSTSTTTAGHISGVTPQDIQFRL